MAGAGASCVSLCYWRGSSARCSTLGSIVTWWRIPGARRDGFELIGIALSTAYFGALVLPTLIMAFVNRWLPFGALLGIAAVSHSLRYGLALAPLALRRGVADLT